MTALLAIVTLLAISAILYSRRERPFMDDLRTVPQEPEARMHLWRERSDALIGTNTGAALERAAKGADAKDWMLRRAKILAKRQDSIQKGYVVPLQLAERFGDAAPAPKLRVVQVEPLRSIRTAFVPKADVPVIVKKAKLSLAR